MVNVVVLEGRLVRDPELRKTAKGTPVVSFTIAQDSIRKNADGSRDAIFMPVSVFGKEAETITKFCSKGTSVAVTGELIQRKYTRKADSAQITSTEIHASHVDIHFGPKAADGSQADGAQAGETKNPAAAPDGKDGAKGGDNLDSIDVVDDDLPF